MAHKKKMTPAQKAAARWEHAAPEEAVSFDASGASPDAESSFAGKGILIAVGLMALVAVCSFVPLGG